MATRKLPGAAVMPPITLLVRTHRYCLFRSLPLPNESTPLPESDEACLARPPCLSPADGSCCNTPTPTPISTADPKSIHDLISASPAWVYVLIPFVAAVVGWATNVVALKMTFYPIEFLGIKVACPSPLPHDPKKTKNPPPSVLPCPSSRGSQLPCFLQMWQPENSPLGFIGWQGIIPTKAGKMAGISARLMTEKLIDVKEVSTAAAEPLPMQFSFPFSCLVQALPG